MQNDPEIVSEEHNDDDDDEHEDDYDDVGHTVRREISILNDLEHPHIVQLVEVFEDTKYIHVVQELCRGGELYQRVGTWTCGEYK